MKNMKEKIAWNNQYCEIPILPVDWLIRELQKEQKQF